MFIAYRLTQPVPRSIARSFPELELLRHDDGSFSLQGEVQGEEVIARLEQALSESGLEGRAAACRLPGLPTSCACCRPCTGPWRRFLAVAMHRLWGRYERAVAPTKERIFGAISGGTVLEIGPGTGSNLPYLAARGVRHWTGIEPVLAAHPYLQRRLQGLGMAGSVVAGIAEALPVPSGSIDVVVSTLVLCSVEDVHRTLAEIRRALRPGGRFIFMEHVLAPLGDSLRTRQQRLSRVWRWLADGCRPDRDTEAALRRAGFASLRLENFTIQNGLITPHIAGVARA